MYGLIKSATASLLMPLPIMVAVFVLGLVIWCCGRSRQGLMVCSAAVGFLVLLSWAPVADRLVGALEKHYPPVLEIAEYENIDAIVVLGGGWSPDLPLQPSAQLSDYSALRLMEGIRLWRQNPDLKLVMTGRSRKLDEESIASGYARAARSLGVPDDRIVRLDWPVDTGQEALAVAELLGKGANIVLVTSASHMPRSVGHFERAGLNPLAAPTQFTAGRNAPDTLRYWVPAAYHLEKSERAIYELLGLIALRWEGK